MVRTEPVRKRRRAPVELDDADKALVELLQQDGRLPYARLATQVGLSEAAVRQRVQRLIEHKVVQIVAVTDPLTLGFTRQVMIGLKVDGDLHKVANSLAAIPEVDYVVICAGNYDLLAELVCTDDEHLLHLLNDQIRAVSGVRTADTFVYLKLTKQTYAWGTR
jgi:Lrp/AsnC family transcriptional regulator, regulator for asnA, asnC and gidA